MVSNLPRFFIRGTVIKYSSKRTGPWLLVPPTRCRWRTLLGISLLVLSKTAKVVHSATTQMSTVYNPHAQPNQAALSPSTQPPPPHLQVCKRIGFHILGPGGGQNVVTPFRRFCPSFPSSRFPVIVIINCPSPTIPPRLRACCTCSLSYESQWRFDASLFLTILTILRHDVITATGRNLLELFGSP